MSGKGKQSSKKAVVKVRESGKTVQPSTLNLDMNVENTETTMSLPILKIADNNRLLPRYNSILLRSAEEGVGMEDRS